jgi:hypothetical protein
VRDTTYRQCGRRECARGSERPARRAGQSGSAGTATRQHSCCRRRACPTRIRRCTTTAGSRGRVVPRARPGRPAGRAGRWCARDCRARWCLPARRSADRTRPGHARCDRRWQSRLRPAEVQRLLLERRPRAMRSPLARWKTRCDRDLSSLQLPIAHQSSPRLRCWTRLAGVLVQCRDREASSCPATSTAPHGTRGQPSRLRERGLRSRPGGQTARGPALQSLQVEHLS